MNLFSAGEAASHELQELAENGNAAPAIAALTGQPGVYSVLVGDAPVLPGQSITLTIEAPEGALLSWVSKLSCTNDGFTGFDSMAITEGTVETGAYDAGTEHNTQSFADLVPACQSLSGVSTSIAGTSTSNPDLAEGGVITLHRGVTAGDGHLTEAHTWTNPVARVTIATADAPKADAPKVTPPSAGSGGLLDANGNALAGLAALAAVMLFATGATMRLASRKA